MLTYGMSIETEILHGCSAWKPLPMTFSKVSITPAQASCQLRPLHMHRPHPNPVKIKMLVDFNGL